MLAVNEKYKLSTYEEISVILESSSKKICVVKNEVDDKLYVKKVYAGTDYFNFYVRFASLRHKNLAEIHDVICSDSTTYVFEEYLNGQTLQTLLKNKGIQPENRVVDYIMQVCDALIYLHDQNPPIIHRDIKPENIMLSSDGVIKLVDFDIAREFKQSATRDTTFMGTKEYAAPEQYGYKQTDARTDIYAIGVLLHEMLTGTLPQNNITYKGALRKIILKCLRLEPKQRYRSVFALKKALASTRANRYKKMAIYSLSGIAVVAAVVLLFSKISDYSYNQNDVPSVPAQKVAERKFDASDSSEDSSAPISMQSIIENSDYLHSQNPDVLSSSQSIIEKFDSLYSTNPDVQLSTQTSIEDIGVSPNPNIDEQLSLHNETDQSSDLAYGKDSDAQGTSQTIMGQNFDEVADLFVKINAYEENPTIVLEHNELNQIIRSITGASYNSVARAFQEYDDSFWKAFYDPDINLFVILACNFENGVKHDRLLFEISEDYMNITYHDSDLETTFYFTTNSDKGLLSENAFTWIKKYAVMYENPVVFSESAITDITGTYYVGNQKKIEIFEESGEMKFSYTDIRSSKDAEPWIVESINKLDDNHYWIKTFTGWNDKEILYFNFSKNHLTLLNMLQDSPDVIYDIAGRGVPTAIDPRGIYNKS